MACNWITQDYFSQLMCADRRSHTALEMLVDDLHAEKERTISTFLCHSGSEDFLWGLVRLLGNDTPRVAGNAAYIIGTLAESELGCYRILSLARGRHPESRKILSDLTRMLTFDDPESVMNAAGTMGTLAESNEGREWMLSEPCVESMLDHVTMLLHTDNLWTASNAALVLARLCISEDGCSSILKHSKSNNILSRLILALGVDEAGRGMNAAFAIGRLCDMDAGRERLLSLPDSEKMISALAKMLSCEDTGASKNACFALSCLATNLEGHSRLLGNANSEDVLKTLSQLLSAEDSETAWFAAMTLRTLASQPKGCLRLREFPQVHIALKKIEQMSDANPDLKEEVVITLEILKRLDPPDPPSVTVLGPDLCHASWNQVTTKSGFEVRYQLFEGSKCFYSGPKCQHEITSLSPYTTYNFKVRAVTEGDESPFSEPTTVTTEEDLPEAPQNIRILGMTITQLKIGWDPPEHFNGVSKGYYVYQGKSMVEHTTETSAIISGLTANTTYEIQVCAATSKGKGPRAPCSGTTAELGAHAPSKPHVQVLGRNEVHVSWEPPEVPMGRITRYDVSMNGKIIYSGTDLSCGAHRLTPDTEYTFVVTALTNEGKFESKATKKRTAKDEFDPSRPPLYQPPKKEEEPQKSASQKKRKSVGEVKSARIHSAKGSHVSCTPDRPVSASSALSCHRTHGQETPRADKDEESRSHSPAQKARTVVKPSDTKKENIRPRTHKEPTSSSSSRNTPSATGPREQPSSNTSHKVYTSRIDKPSGLSKPSFPVTVSYVSIQGGDDQNLELDAIGPEYPKKTFIRSPTFYDNSNPTLRIERSKTSLTQGKSRSNRLGKLGKVDSNSSMNGDLSRHISSGPMQRSSHSTPEQRLSIPGSSGINGKPTWLPKPTIPSTDYLDGSRGLSANSDGPSPVRSVSSPRSSMDWGAGYALEAEMESPESQYQRVKRKDDEHSTMIYTRSRTPVDSYYIEAQNAFIQRTNTFINSHRPGLKRNHAIHAPVHLLGSTSFILPENKLATQRTHNKFVPMQLRTQPNNLTAGQLQRMNTTLSEPSRGGLPGRRLEALTRSHTQVSMRSHSHAHAANRSAPLSHTSLTPTEMDMLNVQTQGLINGTSKQERIQPRV